jgi:hypothetical protein
MVIPVSPLEGVEPDETPPDSILNRDPHIATGDAALLQNLGSSTSGNIGNDGHSSDDSDDRDGSDGGEDSNRDGGDDRDDGDGDTRNRVANLEAFIDTPLRLGQTLVVYHPHSERSPEIINTAELTLPREPLHLPPPTEPWAPFSSRDNFEQAELFIKHNCTNRHINDQLRLNRKRDSHNYNPNNPPPMKNAREMHSILDEARSDLDISLVGSFYPYSRSH